MLQHGNATIGQSVSDSGAEPSPRPAFLLDLPHFIGRAFLPPESEAAKVSPYRVPIVSARPFFDLICCYQLPTDDTHVAAAPARPDGPRREREGATLQAVAYGMTRVIHVRGAREAPGLVQEATTEFDSEAGRHEGATGGGERLGGDLGEHGCTIACPSLTQWAPRRSAHFAYLTHPIAPTPRPCLRR